MQELVTGGYNPIVFVDMRPIYGFKGVHAMVVIGTHEQTVTVLDPLKEKYSLPLQSFATAWAMRHNIVIIVER